MHVLVLALVRMQVRVRARVRAHVCARVRVHVCVCMCARAKQVGMCTGLVVCYGVALVSRIDKIVGLFCKRAL